MEALVGLIVGIVISGLFSGLIIWIVSKLNLGLHVESFGWAIIAGLLIGIITNLVMQVVPATNQILSIIINLVISAAVILGCGSFLKGMTVKGFGGALIAAVAIAVVSFLIVAVFLGGAALVGQAAS